MKIFLTIIKLALTTLACVFFLHGNTIFDQTVMFALCYGLITYYIYYIKQWINEGIDDGGMDEGIVMIIINFMIKLLMPLLILLIPYWIFQKIFGETVGSTIASICILLISFGCLISDIVGIIQIFKPDFLNGGKKADSGFIEDDVEE